MKKTATRLVTLAGIIIAAFSLTACGAAVDKALSDAVKQLNESTPMLVDSETQLDNAEAPGNRVLRYNYSLVNIAQGDLTAEEINELEQGVAPGVITQIKGNASMDPLKSLDVIFEFRYSTNDGQELFTIRVEPEDYK
ncbi:MAG: hypothetical protein FWG15_01325 [Propionibacteriaceae bacterium]|jgi:hypothetical protein|nr:hypothetical protein [Propionibacteriaceae bacterium]